MQPLNDAERTAAAGREIERVAGVAEFEREVVGGVNDVVDGSLAGGFEAILDRVCDDYELAQLYRRAGLRLAQTTITHPASTSHGRLTEAQRQSILDAR